jgi:ergothioneine biosynthesis protein EgtB
LRSSFSRPGLDAILRYREHVDAAMERLFEQGPEEEALRRIELGVNHEEQHQELLLTDILHAFFTNPLKPKYREQGSKGAREQENRERATPAGNNRPPGTPAGSEGAREPLEFRQFDGGLREAGHAGNGFCFDNELPRHRVWLEPYALANRLVTCGEYAEFIVDGGYRKPELWLSAGWDAVKQNGWRAPLYWSDEGGSQRESEWSVFTLRGERSLEELATTPVSQVSFFEADAYARWAGRRFPRRLSGRLRRRVSRWREICWILRNLRLSLPRISSKTRAVRSTTGTVGFGLAAPTWAIRDSFL